MSLAFSRYSLLVLENGHLVAEHCFNGGSVDRRDQIQSISKSFLSAAIVVAIEKGCIESIDQRMIEFFPEYADRVTDPRRRASLQPGLRAGLSTDVTVYTK